ncbi:iron-containing redox enzyme family protein [Actinocorallia sp. B10E7]|uniref:TenA family transcriptional regulator n=1 Tax=Actinocorallia sp. B10E7 TaxID=3153558 RepID=UPI00325C49FB
MDSALLGRLDKIIDDSAYVRHSFTETLVSGSVSRDQLRSWAIQKYHQTFLQNCGFSAIHARAMHHEDVRQWEMEQLIAEETDIRDGSDSHYNLMKRFAIAMGADEDLDGVGPAPEVLEFIDYLVGTCLDEHFVYGLLAFYVNERQTPAAAQRMYDYLTKEMGVSRKDAEWFLVHGEVDVYHAREARVLIEKYADDAPGFETRAEEIVRDGCAHWRRLQDFYFSKISA